MLALRVLALALAATAVAGNPAERVLGMLDGLTSELGTESTSKIAAFKMSEGECGTAEAAVRAKVDGKNAEVRAVMDKVADEEKSMSIKGEALKKLQAASGASEVVVSMNVERLKGIMANIMLANKTAHAATEQHGKKMKSLQKAYGVVQTLIQFVKRAFERQANSKVHGPAPASGDAGRHAPDTSNPKEVGIRGALDAASDERKVGGDAAAPRVSDATQFEKDLTLTPAVDNAPQQPGSEMSFKRISTSLKKAFAPDGALASHRHTRTATDLMDAIAKFQATAGNGRSLLQVASKPLKKRQNQSSKIYELMVALAQAIKLEHDSELESNARTVAAGDKLMRALLKQRATIQAVLLKEAAKDFAAKVAAAEKEIGGHQSTIKEQSKKLEGHREHLMRLTADLDDQHQKCKGISTQRDTYEYETSKQKRLISEIDTIIKDRVAKVKALVDKNIKDAAGLIKEASAPPS